MQEEMLKKVREIEEKLKQGTPIKKEDHAFLFALTLLKGNNE